MIRVWSLFVRLAHWTLVAAVLGAWWTRHGGAWHEWLGYLALVVVIARVVCGFAVPDSSQATQTSRFVRFRNFVRGPRETLAYARELIRLNEPRHIGHNPLGGWMIVLLIVAVICTAASGVLYTTPQFWGVKWVEDVHEFFANALLALACLHVAGVVFTSFRHHENLLRAMVTGNKRE